MGKNKNYMPRLIDAQLKDRLSWKGAVCVEGPKWCGKTWSCQEQAQSSFLVGSPAGNFSNRLLAKENPMLALEGKTPHLIDEWQEAPGIWDAVRMEVDARGEYGQFILTGSSTPRIKGIMHSGTGRITKLRMRSMSLFEAGNSTGRVSVKDLFDGNFSDAMTGDIDIREIAMLITRGGWPGILNAGEHAALQNSRDYVSSFLEEDLPRIDDNRSFRDGRKMRFLLESLARNESTTASVSKLRTDISIATDMDITQETVNEYLEILKRSFLIEDQNAFTFSARSKNRLKQAPKRHLTDPSLVCALLSLTPEKLIGDLNTFGFLFESLAEHDLDIYARSLNGNLYHYQDYSNREIDAVLELEDGRWGAFEIKLGASQIDKAAENLLKTEKAIREDNPENTPAFLAVICGLSNAAYRRKDGVYVIPLTALKP